MLARSRVEATALNLASAASSYRLLRSWPSGTVVIYLNRRRHDAANRLPMKAVAIAGGPERQLPGR